MVKLPLIFVLNGPNLNLLGEREPEIYGNETLEDIGVMLSVRAADLGLELDIRQSNHEGDLLDWLHAAHCERVAAVLLNAGALSHESIALYDAIKAVALPVIEVHLSNPHARESFRHHSYISMAAAGSIAGFGSQSYLLALEAAASLIVRRNSSARRK